MWTIHIVGFNVIKCSKLELITREAICNVLAVWKRIQFKNLLTYYLLYVDTMIHWFLRKVCECFSKYVKIWIELNNKYFWYLLNRPLFWQKITQNQHSFIQYVEIVEDRNYKNIHISNIYMVMCKKLRNRIFILIFLYTLIVISYNY